MGTDRTPEDRQTDADDVDPVEFLRAMLAIRAEDAATAREDARADGNVEDPHKTD